MGKIMVKTSTLTLSFALLLFFSISFSICSGNASISVPAIVGDNGGELVSLSVKLIDGHGDIYITTSPRTGVSTQESAENSVELAFKKSNRDILSCDTIIHIGGKNIASYVDGPSAGAAFSVLTFAALNSITIPENIAITGATNIYGSVEPVGGLFEKTKAAINGGKKYIVTPLNTIAERVILKPLKEKYGIAVIEVSNIDEAITFVLYGKEPQLRELTPVDRGMPNVTVFVTGGLGKFNDVALEMLRLENESVSRLPDHDNDSIQIKQYFANEVKRQMELFKLGYVFSAANEAFLNYIDIETVGVVGTGNLDLEQKYNEINSCLGAFTPKAKTKDNFEYVIGSELREEWATKKLNGINLSKSQLFEEKYYAFNEMMYADAWCKIANQLNAVDATGQVLDEMKWKEFSSKIIADADNLGITSAEWKARVENAKHLFERGKYGAAVYDAVFAIEMHKADTNPQDAATLKQNVEKFASEKRVSIWGKIYQTQGVFLSQGGEGELPGAYKILVYAAALDNATLEMKQLAGVSGNVSDASPQLSQSSQSPQIWQTWQDYSQNLDKTKVSEYLFFGSLALIFAAVVLLMLLRKRKNARSASSGKYPQYRNKTSKTSRIKNIKY